VCEREVCGGVRGGGGGGGERERPLLALSRCGIGTRRPRSLLRLRLLKLFARLAAWTSEFSSRSEVRPSVRRNQTSQQKRPIITLRSAQVSEETQHHRKRVLISQQTRPLITSIPEVRPQTRFTSLMTAFFPPNRPPPSPLQCAAAVAPGQGTGAKLVSVVDIITTGSNGPPPPPPPPQDVACSRTALLSNPPPPPLAAAALMVTTLHILYVIYLYIIVDYIIILTKET